ncbi:hypothetical protein GCM10023093_16190 [Nemorincola caseinilytica]|uniref:Nucleotidyltransferase domain-containing protein n=1 Tax=Nemorincola caseinilytica TaxID=2054315 RepID=A0ABP8NF85_9BACT
MILTIEHIKKVITDYFAQKPVKRVWLFGSYARVEADEIAMWMCWWTIKPFIDTDKQIIYERDASR